MTDNAAVKSHDVSLFSRKRMTLTGVCDVKSYDDGRIVLATSMGGMVIIGSGLKINKVNTENGDADIEGTVKSLEYTESGAEKGFFRKLLR